MNRCWPRWLSHRNGEEAAGAVTTPKTSASPEPISLNQPEYHRENVRLGPKTIPKTVRKIVKTSNNRPYFRMVGTYATAVSISTKPRGHQLGTALAALRLRQRSCQNRAQRDPAATPPDPRADPWCRQTSLRGASWRNERQNYGATAQRKPGVCPKCTPNLCKCACSVV